MSNSAFLLAGSDAQLDTWWDEGEASVIAQRGNGVPVLWAAMFEPCEIRLRNVGSGSDGFVTYSLRTKAQAAADRLLGRHTAVARLLSVPADLSKWAGIMADVLRGIKADFIELDVTEVALLDDPQRFVAELRAFLEFVSNSKHYSGAASFLPSRKRIRQNARSFTDYHCNLLDTKHVPSVEEGKRQPQEHGKTVANLIGDFTPTSGMSSGSGG